MLLKVIGDVIWRKIPNMKTLKGFLMKILPIEPVVNFS